MSQKWHIYVTLKNLKPKFIVRIFLCSIKAITTTHLLNTPWLSICRAFWSQQNHQTYFKGFLVATNVEIYERIDLCLGYVCEQKHHAISHMVYSNHSQSLKVHNCLLLWTSSQISHVSNPIWHYYFVIDWLTKVAHFIPTTKTMASEGV